MPERNPLHENDQPGYKALHIAHHLSAAAAATRKAAPMSSPRSAEWLGLDTAV